MRSRRALIAVGATIAIVAVFLTFIAAAPPIAYDGEPGLVANPADHVDTLIGTGTGGETVGEINNFPGASLPFGMVQYSPDTVNNYAGYDYENPRSTGFSMTHASVGCAAFGDISMLPTTTPIGSEPRNAWERIAPNTTTHRRRPVQIPAQRSAGPVPCTLRRVAGGQLPRDHPDRRGQHHDHRMGD